MLGLGLEETELSVKSATEDTETCYPEDRACEPEFAHLYNDELSRIDTESIAQESEAEETVHPSR